MGELIALDSVFYSHYIRVIDLGKYIELVLNHAFRLVLPYFEIVEAFDRHQFSTQSVLRLVHTGESSFPQMFCELIVFVELYILYSRWDHLFLL